MEIQWSLVLFTVLAGTGAWLYFAFCLGALRSQLEQKRTKIVVPVASLACALVGTLASVTHLSHPDRIMAVLGHPTMGIFTEALFVGLLVIAAAVYLFAVYRGASERATRVILAIGAVIAVLLAFMLGYSYMMPARPQWATPLLPLAYFLTTTSCGAAAYALLLGLCREADKAMATAQVLVVAGGVLFGVSALAYGAASGSLSGEALPQWLAVVACGSLVPLACGLVARLRSSQALLLSVVALVFSLIGSGAFRCLMWTVGEAVRNYFGIAI